MTWTQNYNPAGHWLLSTLLAAIPVLILLSALAIFRIKAHFAALLGLVTSLAIACFIFGMPLKMGAMSAVYGILYGLFPIGWIVLNVIFMYDLTCEAGHFKVLQQSLMGITQDRRLQLVLIAFAFGAFFEGACGFGTPVAVTAAILIGIGFKPLQASGLSLIANTAPVAFGALGTPLIALSGVSGINLLQLSGMTGRILPFFSLVVPFWLIWTFAGFDGMLESGPPLCRRTFLRGPAIPDVQSSRPVARRCRRFRLLHRWSHAPAAVLASKTNLGTRRPRIRSRRPRRTRSRALCRNQSMDAMGHPQRRRLRMGIAHNESISRSRIEPKNSDRESAQSVAARSSGRTKTNAGTRDFPAELALRIGHRNPLLRNHFRILDGIQPDPPRTPICKDALSRTFLADYHRRDDGHRLYNAILRHSTPPWA